MKLGHSQREMYVTAGTMQQPARHPYRALRLGVVLAFLLGMGAWLLAEHRARASGPETVFVRYYLDRHAVPAWVSHRELTLRLQAGNAESLWAWGDGRPLAVRHDPTTGIAWITTAATEVLVAMQGEALGADETLGDYVVTTLKDDKAWAYSLTFDDGALSVYEYAYPELRRYDYRAAVAVIGQWLERPDALAYNYCGRNELQTLRDVGWSIFNHSYSHYNSPGDITLEDARRAQEVIRNQLDGYRCTVFTVPYTNQAWVPIIDENSESLGIYLMQLVAENGERLTLVDAPIALNGRTYHLGRDDIKDWVEGDYSYFGHAHSLATSSAPARSWVSLHGHQALYNRDWCALAESTAALYHTYGAGGSDEVWVAPADEVFQYLVTRSYATVQRQEGVPRELGPQLRAPVTVTYRQGVSGYEGWQDTWINEANPLQNYDTEGRLVVYSGQGMHAATLLRAELTPPAEGAVVLHATLSLYAMRHTNPAGVDLWAYPLTRSWNVAQATWLSPSADVGWDEAGARDPEGDRDETLRATTHIENCQGSARWYTFDITEMVARWLAHPDENYGLVIESRAGVSKGTTFASSDHVTEGWRPLLVVHYGWPTEGSILPTATPTATPIPRWQIGLPLVVRPRKP